jgi:hypothetical protein
MITFSRSSVVGAEFIDDDKIRFSGEQEDHIYSMEIRMDLRISDGEILAIEGWMKRYTNPYCTKSLEVLKTAKGISVKEDGWDNRIMREIGRMGCEHFAEIIIECGRCLNAALLTAYLAQKKNDNPDLDFHQAADQWLSTRPDLKGACMTR